MHFGSKEAASCIMKFTWHKLSLLCSGLGQEMDFNVLAFLPCSCWLAFMHLGIELSKDTYHRRVRCRTHIDPKYNLHAVLLAPIEKTDMSIDPQQGMKITTGQS